MITSKNRLGTIKMTLDEMVESKVREILAEKGLADKTTTVPEWRELSKEIHEYILKQRDDSEKIVPAYSGIQNAIYQPIKYVLGLSRIDRMNEEQAKVARQIFEFIKNKRRINELKMGGES